MFGNEGGHDLNAHGVVQNFDSDTVVPEEVLRTLERAVLSNHHPRYAIEEQGTRAHGTRRKCRIEHRLSVVGCRESACVLQRRHLGMEHHRAPLHPLVVATPDNLPVDRQDRTDWHATFCQPEARLVNSYPEQGIGHAVSLPVRRGCTDPPRAWLVPAELPRPATVRPKTHRPRQP